MPISPYMKGMREPHYLGAKPRFVPRAVGSLIEYNGLVMNDRRRLDQIVITEVGGMDGADVRDARDPNPDRDGETPLDANYSGRTLTLKGYVVAGNENMMDKLFDDVQDAFDDLTEKPLIFRRVDWKDTFVDSNALIDYAADEGSGTYYIASDASGLAPTSTANKIIFVSNTSDGVSAITNGGDVEVIMQANHGTMTDVFFGPVIRRSPNGNHLRVVYSASSETIALWKVVAGMPTSLSMASVTLAPNKDYWIMVRAEGTLVTYSVWDVYPPDIGGTPLASNICTLAGGDVAAFPTLMGGSRSLNGMFWAPNSVADRVKLLDVGALNPGDPFINVRKFGKIDSPDNQTTANFRRDFLITVRASDSRFVSRKVYTTSIVPSPFALTFDAGGAGLTFPISGAGLIFGSALPSAVVNLGRSPASPVIRFYGAMANPALYHPVTGRVIAINGVIAEGDYLELDVARRTVFDSAGVDRYDMLTDETNWLELLKGSNTLTYGADSSVSPDSSSKIVFYFRHSSR